MAKAGKALWIVTVGSVLSILLLGFTAYGALTLMAGPVAGVLLWPVAISLSLSLVLPVVGLTLRQAAASTAARRVTTALNIGVLTVSILFMTAVGSLFLTTTKQRFIVPEGYRGDVYIIFGVPSGAPVERTRFSVTYRIPQDGVLLTQGRMINGVTRSEYDWQAQDGTLRRIPNLWLATIESTPENLANDRDEGVWAPRSGSADSAPSDCPVDFEEFYVGTQAHFLTKYKERDLDAFLKQHPEACQHNGH